MSKLKKIGIIMVILLIASATIFVYRRTLIINARENLTKVVAATLAQKESHILTVILNQAFYEIEYSNTFDISNIDVKIESDSFTTIQFDDGTTSKTYDSVGEKIEQITVTDEYNNSKIVEITINVIDTEAPIIKGVTDCKITEGHKFNALGGVAAFDNADGEVSDTLTCTEYDINAIGTQKLTITATDKSGNVGSIEFVLEVVEKPIVIIEEVPVLDQESIASIVSIYKELIPYDGKVRSITCWGDSLTEGFGTDINIKIGGLSGATETTTLASLTGKTVYNMGIWGEDSRSIVCRQGGLSMFVNNITIPASGSVSFDKIMCEDGNEVSLCSWDNYAKRECFDACTIGGITGKLTYERQTGLYTFKRAVEGTELVISTDTAIITPTSISRRDDILILEMGNNGGWDAEYKVLIEQYNAMIEYSNCKYFIIVGDTDGDPSERGDWDRALETAFGDHYINMREYLANNGLTDCGLEATSVDLDMISLGEVPDSLKSDWSHLNAYGYYSKGKALYAKGFQLGYWK